MSPKTSVSTTTIYVVEDDVAHLREVLTGFAAEGRVEITDGLLDTDKIVIVGQAGLKDGSKVSIITDENTAESAANNSADE